MFASVAGNRINPSIITHELESVCKKAGIAHVTLHSLRHTNLTMLLMSGVPLNVVSARGGHSLTSTTLNTYCYVLSKTARGAANKAALYLDNLAAKKGAEAGNVLMKSSNI